MSVCYRIGCISKSLRSHTVNPSTWEEETLLEFQDSQGCTVRPTEIKQWRSLVLGVVTTTLISLSLWKERQKG